jgi:hypothetical protein
MQIAERGSQEHRLDYQIAEGTAASRSVHEGWRRCR